MNHIKLYPVAEGIKLLNKGGIKVVVISNQSGVARKYFNCEILKEIDLEIDNRLNQKGAIIDAWYFCPVGFDYAQEKNIVLPNKWVVENPKCRKPNIGMLEQTCKDLEWKINGTQIYLIGNKESDVKTAQNARGKGYLIDMEKHPEEFFRICEDIVKH